jgi:hypothetical protein
MSAGWIVTARHSGMIENREINGKKREGHRYQEEVVMQDNPGMPNQSQHVPVRRGTYLVQ